MAHDRYVSEIRPVGKDRFEVICEQDEPLILYKGELYQYGIQENAVLPADTYDLICDEVLRVRAKHRCMYLIEKQDYTEAQIRQKLSDGCYPQEIIEETVTWLKDMHALDDRRYAQTYLRMNCGRLSRRILLEKLAQRGISRELAGELLDADEELVPDEEAQIRSLLEKKHYDPRTAQQDERDKVRQMLSRKGYGYELIRKMT